MSLYHSSVHPNLVHNSGFRIDHRCMLYHFCSLSDSDKRLYNWVKVYKQADTAFAPASGQPHSHPCLHSALPHLSCFCFVGEHLAPSGYLCLGEQLPVHLVVFFFKWRPLFNLNAEVLPDSRHMTKTST
jgi:hypothetical protein